MDNESSASLNTYDPSSENKTHYINSIPYENFISGKWVIPKSIAEKIIHSLCKKKDPQQKRQFIIDVAKYWSMKRESRGGASLLKRLHIEPWSAFSTSYVGKGKKKLKTLEVLATIRNNLEKMRTMARMIELRERRKLLITKIQKRVIETIHFPISTMVRPVFYDIKKNDREEYFWVPVSAEEVEDYYDIIKHPMSFDIIENKINTHQYKTVKAFKDDMDQIWSNAMLYNKEETHYYITAVKLKNRLNRLIKPIFEEEERLFSQQTVKALRVLLPPQFWNIEFSLSEPLTRPYSIDEYSLEDFETLLNIPSPEEEESIEIVDSDDDMEIIEVDKEEEEVVSTKDKIDAAIEEHISLINKNEENSKTPDLHDISIENDVPYQEEITIRESSMSPTLPYYQKGKSLTEPSFSLLNRDKNKKMSKEKEKDTPINTIGDDVNKTVIDLDREESSYREDDTIGNSMIDIDIAEAENIIHSAENINRLVEHKLKDESKLLKKHSMKEMENTDENIFFMKSPKSLKDKGISSSDLLKDKTFIDLNSKTIPNTSISISIHTISVKMSSTNDTENEINQENVESVERSEGEGLKEKEPANQVGSLEKEKMKEETPQEPTKSESESSKNEELLSSKSNENKVSPKNEEINKQISQDQPSSTVEPSITSKNNNRPEESNSIDDAVIPVEPNEPLAIHENEPMDQKEENDQENTIVEEAKDETIINPKFDKGKESVEGQKDTKMDLDSSVERGKRRLSLNKRKKKPDTNINNDNNGDDKIVMKDNVSEERMNEDDVPSLVGVEKEKKDTTDKVTDGKGQKEKEKKEKTVKITDEESQKEKGKKDKTIKSTDEKEQKEERKKDKTIKSTDEESQKEDKKKDKNIKITDEKSPKKGEEEEKNNANETTIKENKDKEAVSKDSKIKDKVIEIPDVESKRTRELPVRRSKRNRRGHRELQDLLANADSMNSRSNRSSNVPSDEDFVDDSTSRSKSSRKKTDDAQGEPVRKRKFEDRDKVEGYLDENNKYQETEELKERYRELERELKESEILDGSSDISVNLPEENESLGSLSISDGDEHFLNVYSLPKTDELDGELSSVFQKVKKDVHQTILRINKEKETTSPRKTRSRRRKSKDTAEDNGKEMLVIDERLSTPSVSYEIIDIDDDDDDDNMESDNKDISKETKSQQQQYQQQHQQQKKKAMEERDYEKFLKEYSRDKMVRLKLKEQEDQMKAKVKAEAEAEAKAQAKAQTKAQAKAKAKAKTEAEAQAQSQDKSTASSATTSTTTAATKKRGRNTLSKESMKRHRSNSSTNLSDQSQDNKSDDSSTTSTTIPGQRRSNRRTRESATSSSNKMVVKEIINIQDQDTIEDKDKKKIDKKKEKGKRKEKEKEKEKEEEEEEEEEEEVNLKSLVEKIKTKSKEEKNDKDTTNSGKKAVTNTTTTNASSTITNNNKSSSGRGPSRSSSRINSKNNSQVNSPKITVDLTENEETPENEHYVFRTRRSRRNSTIKEEVEINVEEIDVENYVSISASDEPLEDQLTTYHSNKKRKPDHGKDEKINPAKRSRTRTTSTSTSSDETLTSSSMNSSSSGSQHSKGHSKRMVPKWTGPSSSTKVKQIVITEEAMHAKRIRAIQQFKESTLHSKRCNEYQQLDSNKDWLTYLRYNCGADIVSDLIKKPTNGVRFKGWYWQRI